ncbi:DegT/DnrJ/EryC1/StrS family aminotransferase [Nocardia sp. alder85J]|uniref:DegT/DnrJ/EryC1/StrS family aminotransferase n=1 Tax=Nocardia sp. alder85J TaxID=2862949 RepID=UPI003A4DCA0E
MDAVVRYPVPIHRQPAFADHRFGGPFPHTDHQATATVCLPIRPDLTGDDIDYVTATLHHASNIGQETHP